MASNSSVYNKWDSYRTPNNSVKGGEDAFKCACRIDRNGAMPGARGDENRLPRRLPQHEHAQRLAHFDAVARLHIEQPRRKMTGLHAIQAQLKPVGSRWRRGQGVRA